MALKDSTNILRSSIEQKAKTGKNFDIKDNYWLQGIQDKVNAEWTYRSNRVDIEEEKTKQLFYTKEPPKFTPLEVVIQEVVTDKGEKLSKDWKRLVFKDCTYHNYVGKRFRFSHDFAKFQTLSEEEKKWNSSVWLGTNEEGAAPTEGIVVRRCNTTIGFAGTRTGKVGGGTENTIVEYHYEPAILENDLKYINTYFNQTLNTAQAELYAIFQYNYFTQFINIEDRFLLGEGNPFDNEKNNSYRVKSVEKFTANNTYDFDNPNIELAEVPYVVVGLDKTPLEEGDNYKKGTLGYRVASRPPVYKVEDTQIPTSEEEYAIVLDEPYETQINAEEKAAYSVYIYQGNKKLEGEGYTIEVTTELQGTSKPEKYYNLEIQDNNNFIINCVFGYVKSNLLITLQWKERPEFKKQFEVELRSW